MHLTNQETFTADLTAKKNVVSDLPPSDAAAVGDRRGRAVVEDGDPVEAAAVPGRALQRERQPRQTDHLACPQRETRQTDVRTDVDVGPPVGS